MATLVPLSKRDADRIVEYRRTMWGTIIWPRSDQAWCAYYRALDIRFGTEPDEVPLGHNWRCPLHGRKPR